MPIVYPDILNLSYKDVAFSWDDRDAMLYALGVGLGADPLDEQELSFVYEKKLRVLPSFATIVCRNAAPRPQGLNRALVLDGGRDLILHRPLSGAGSVLMDGRIVAVSDKGADKGAIIRREVVMRDSATGEKIATVFSDIVARGDGGFGGPCDSLQGYSEKPAREPDCRVAIPTRENQALLYRLSGDRNPLHSDPEFAERAGFERPILHGLCTYGICCRAVLQTFGAFDPAALKRLAARFSAPCLPGETVVVDFWEEGDEIHFEAHAKERAVTIIKSGLAVMN
jgi:acyl dehydratase